VNVSAVQLEDDNFVSYLEDQVQLGICDPTLIDVEVTESVGVYNIGHTISLLERLQNLGVTISLDDFGTGYSSLTYLRKLPLDYLKIDKSFIDDIFDTKSFCEDIIGITKKLNLKTVAEGIETKEQHEVLREYGCDILQGYLFSKPVPYEALIDYIQESYTKK
jgi:EAL domain-containing protein (putative c-di-GMP-specific phosphodiesterase class I)